MPDTKRLLVLSIFSILAFSCNTTPENSGNDSIPKPDTSKITADSVVITADSTKLIGTHLVDTVYIHGNEVIFLRPDSIRFESYAKKIKNGIYEADSDFGFAISMAIDTIIGNKSFKGVKAMVSTKRYIQLMDCKGGPIIIDRDSINYGIILTATGKKFEAEQNIFPGEHYIRIVRKYFNIKK